MEKCRVCDGEGHICAYRTKSKDNYFVNPWRLCPVCEGKREVNQKNDNKPATITARQHSWLIANPYVFIYTFHNLGKNNNVVVSVSSFPLDAGVFRA